MLSSIVSVTIDLIKFANRSVNTIMIDEDMIEPYLKKRQKRHDLFVLVVESIRDIYQTNDGYASNGPPLL